MNQVLTQEELNILKSIREEYSNLIVNLGQIEVDLVNLLEYKESLKQTLKSIKQKETNEVDQIRKKYGDGNINLETGEFSVI
jgi:hypothetical protein